MKYICLGYIEPGKFGGMTEEERHAVLDECFEHNDHLRANGHVVAELALQPPETALTPVPEERESRDDRRPLCGNQGAVRRPSILEARDLNHAIQLVSLLPGFNYVNLD